MHQKNTNTSEARDLASSSKSFLRVWGPPILLMVASSIGKNVGWWSITAAGVLWSVGTFWMGLRCLLNALHCGRTHCYAIGVFYPVMGFLSLGITFNIVNFDWSMFGNIFIVGTILTFVPEFFGKKYRNSHGGDGG